MVFGILLIQKKAVPFNTNSVKFYHDVANKKIYLIYQNPYIIAGNKSEQDDLNFYVQCLDLVTKTWWNDPMLFNKALVAKLENFEEFNRAAFNTQQGLLLDLEGEFKLLDFKNNKFKNISREKNVYLFNSTYKPFGKLYFNKDRSIHILN